MIQTCANCADYRSEAAKYQDEKHGKGKRVHNACGGKNRGKIRCTVCAKEK